MLKQIIIIFDLFIFIFSYLIIVIFVLIGVSFLTLMERKVLGLIQLRKGPLKVGVLGFLQPFRDAIKLFTKENINPLIVNYFIFYFSPVLIFFLSIFIWVSIPFISLIINFEYGILFILCISRLGVYPLIIAGWSSNSYYSILGSLRRVAQSVSYEVRFSLILIGLIILLDRLNLIIFYKIQGYTWLLIICLPIFLLFITSVLAETNRSPFDFAEGESELVSGFNVEYSGGGFAILFMAEYRNILFIRILIVNLIFGGDYWRLIFYFKLVLISFLIIWVRGTLPRFRYDKLMSIVWKVYLLISMNFIILFYGVKVLLYTIFL